MQDTNAILSDVIARLQNLENRKPEPVNLPTQSPRFGINYLAARSLVADATITSDLGWTRVDARKHGVPESARYAVVWAGIKDTTDGTGKSIMEATDGNVVIPLSEIHEPATDSPQNGFCYSFVPLTVGSFNYRVDMGSGASNLLYKMEVVGWIE